MTDKDTLRPCQWFKDKMDSFRDDYEFIAERKRIDDLASQVASQMPLRATEDIDRWAENLANDVCTLTD